MAQYLEELVQEISTHCDTSGMNKLIKSQKEAIKYNSILQNTFNRLSKQQRINFTTTKALTQAGLSDIRVKEAQAKSNLRLAEAEARHARNMDRINSKTRTHNNLITRSIRTMATYFVGWQMATNFVSNARRMDLMQKSLQGLTKSSQDFDYVRSEAYRTGTNIFDTAKGYKNFYASANMAGFAKSDIQGMFSDLLTTTRAIGASSTQTVGAMLSLDQMLSKGTVSMEELKKQLGNALPGAFEIGAKAMNMTTAEFNDFVKSGKLASNVFVPRLIKQLKKELGGGFVEATNSMDYALRNLETAWIDFQFELSKTGAMREFVNLIKSITSLLKNPMFLASIKKIGDFLGFLMKIMPLLIGSLGLMGIAKGLATIIEFITLLKGLKTWIMIDAITGGVIGLNGALGATLGLLGAIFKVVIPLAAALGVAQDLAYGVIGFFRPDLGLQSYTGDILGGASTKLGQGSNFTTLKNRVDLANKGFSMRKPQNIGLPSLPLSSTLGANFSKSEVTSAAVGDLNFYIYETQNARQTGNEVEMTLSNVLNRMLYRGNK